MEYRRLGKTDYEVSAIGFGAWGIGGDWGEVDDDTSLSALHAAVDAGVTFFDTADVYGDGRSEKLIAQLRRERDEDLIVATKIGRRAPLDLEHYIPRNFEAWIDRSLSNLDTERLDLVQLHCLPTDIYYRPDIFEALDALKERGKIAHYGVSVERVEEALKAIEFAGVATVQIIFNMLRQRPAERFFPEAERRDVGVIARVPLASGLLTGKFTRESAFADDDHRKFNRHGEAFDVGETFAGVDYDAGLDAVEEIRAALAEAAPLAQAALRWILMEEAVGSVIPGAKKPEQARANAAAADLPPLDAAFMEQVRLVYADRIAPLVHQLW
jgi:aryl-alcohol dehydrogenase-like predicted oxidoreductase